jgi:hypothetical protein
MPRVFGSLGERDAAALRIRPIWWSYRTLV